MITLALLLSLSPAQSTPTGEKAPEFSCKVVVSLDRHLEDRWNHTSSHEGVRISSASEVVRQQYFSIYPVFTCMSLDAKGRCRITLDVRIEKPDGTTYFEADGLDAYEGIVGDTRGVHLSRQLIKACFDPPDALGKYEIAITAHDLVSGRSSQSKHVLELVEYEEGEDFADDAELQAWQSGWFEAPAPARAIPALLAFAANGWESEKPIDARGFFREVFEQNHWLFAELLPRFEELDTGARRAVLWLLSRSTYDASAFLEALSEDDAATWDSIRSASHDPLVDPIAGRTDLNELWSMYSATRRYILIERLCWALAADETGVVEDSTIHEPKSNVDVPLGLVVGGVVAKQLREMAGRDPVTRHYVEWMSAQDSTPAGVRKKIDSILRE